MAPGLVEGKLSDWIGGVGGGIADSVGILSRSFERRAIRADAQRCELIAVDQVYANAMTVKDD
jgi:hypothetical protein